ncbi:MAG: hypothetical protein EPN26_05765 [Rhodospirillales bacterium]|nr:MAG: hypothetical protein EPN26_05765 [Rhodospirillales bacterium]
MKEIHRKALHVLGIAVCLLLATSHGAMAQSGGANPPAMFLGVIAALGFVAIVLKFSKSSMLLRDRKPYDGLTGLSPKQHPYSLSRLQMAAWTAIVIGSYIFLAIGKQEFNVLNNDALILMGIAMATTMGAATIDHSTPDGDSIEKAYTAAKEAQEALQTATGDKSAAQAAFDQAQKVLKEIAPKSVNLLADILSDANGVNLQRMQMVAWTLVIMFVFVGSVIWKLEMPTLDKELLSLMGISNGAYVGLKIPEKQAVELP